MLFKDGWLDKMNLLYTCYPDLLGSN